MLEAGIWECYVHQDRESLDFMQQVLYITPCLIFLMQGKEMRKSVQHYGSISLFWGEKVTYS